MDGQKKSSSNLADVDYIDSSGLGELVSAYTTVKNQGGELKLLSFTKRVHDILQITCASSPSSTSNPTKPTPSAASSNAAFNQRRTAPQPPSLCYYFCVLIPL